jgi:hypothetical protein
MTKRGLAMQSNGRSYFLVIAYNAATGEDQTFGVSTDYPHPVNVIWCFKQNRKAENNGLCPWKIDDLYEVPASSLEKYLDFPAIANGWGLTPTQSIAA